MEVSNKSNDSKAVVKQPQNGNTGDQDGDEMENPMLSLPKEVMRRVNALKNIQLKMVDVETKFYEELHLLECKYAKMYEGYYEQREKIINGSYEPNDEEAKFTLDAMDLINDINEKIQLEDKGEKTSEEPVKGVPDFWLHAMKSTDILGSAIQPHDEPILQHLRDIRVHMKSEKPFGYTIEFVFEPNEFFTNTVLTKTYELTTDKDERDPFGYDGPALYKSVGCKIDWHKGKDVTMRVVKKKQKHKSTGTIRVVSKEEKQDSFFNFFESPTPDGIRPSYKSITSPSQFKTDDSGQMDDEDEMNEEDEELYEADFEIGHFLKEFLIPKAVLYYTGELIDEANYEDEDYDDEEDDDDDEDISGINNAEEDDDEEDGEDDRKAKAKTANPKKPAQGKAKNTKP